ncbi:MAG: hypothetical protein Q8R98_19845 [Rubrivivax sp.]|nr:hypothetical protein [Rubrivivax sp.]MDP3614101.1 hypothetical protein [Rubrivivax sp.]
MHPEDIKAHIRKAGHSQTSVAGKVQGRNGKVSPGAVWAVIQGVMTSAPIARSVSEVTSIPVGQLWPGRYPTLEAEQTTQRRGGKKARA